MTESSAENSGRCSGMNSDGSQCGRPGTLPDQRSGGLICEIHAWERWRSWEDLLPVLEAIGQGTVPKLPAMRSLMWVLVETPMLALQTIISGYGSMVEAIDRELQARDPEMAREVMSIGARALAAKTMAGLMEVPAERRELLMNQSGLRQFLESYRDLVEREEGEG